MLVSPKRRAQVADFGISRLLSFTTTIGTTTGAVKGTDRWMAPELFQPVSDEDIYTTEADIWALGMTLYASISKILQH